MRLWATFCLFGALADGLWAGPVQTIAPDAIADRFRTLAPENQRLAGLLSSRIRANTEGLLEHIDVAALLAPYGKTGSKESGELAGRYLLAAAHAYEYRQEPELRALLDRVAAALAKAQSADGYLGLAAEQERMKAADLRVQRANLLGLLAYYQATGEELAYTVSQKIGDLLVQKLKGRVPEDRLVAATLAEPLVVLYRYTAEPAYLELAKTLVKANSDISEGSVAERLAYYVSLAELYRVSGDESYLRESLRGWAGYAGENLSITGVPSTGGEAEISNCVTSTWLRLTLALMRLTGQQKYGDQVEKTIYNHLLAGQDIRSGEVCATTPETGKKKFLSRTMASVSPCALAEADGLALISQTLWGRWANGIAINLYNPGRGSFQLRRRALIQIYLESSYPEHGDILLHVEPSRNARFPLRLRVPDWATHFTADFGSSHLIGKAGEFLLIDREWKRGDTVKIVIGMRTQVLSANRNGEERVALKRGAEVLVVNRALNPQIKNLTQVVPSMGEGEMPVLTSLENKMPRFWVGEEGYSMKCEYEGKAQTATLVPFADAYEFAMWFEKGRPGSL